MVLPSRIALACLLTTGLQAQDLSAETEAKFLKILLSSTGQFGFACSDPAFKARLETAGIAAGAAFPRSMEARR